MLVNGLQLGMMIFDVEMTQHCIADHHCQEGNPLMPSSHAGQLAVGFRVCRLWIGPQLLVKETQIENSGGFLRWAAQLLML